MWTMPFDLTRLQSGSTQGAQRHNVGAGEDRPLSVDMVNEADGADPRQLGYNDRQITQVFARGNWTCARTAEQAPPEL
jgi:hypothetical protein